MDTSKQRHALRRANRHHSPSSGPSVAFALAGVIFWALALVLVLVVVVWLVTLPPA